MQRNSTRTRTQTFHWVSATLLYYLCDRAASYFNHHYKVKLESSFAMDTTGNGSKMVRSISGVAILVALSVFGIMLIALTISWVNNNGFGIRNVMITFLEVSTVLFQVSFAVAAFFLWNGGQLLSLVDTVDSCYLLLTQFSALWHRLQTSSGLSNTLGAHRGQRC